MQNKDTQLQFEMERLVSSKSTKSDKIRALDAAGYKRADIARFLDIRYQHVRNVLVQDAAKASNVLEAPHEAKEASSNVVWTRVSEGGRVVLPALFRAQLGMEEGEEVQLELHDGEIVLRTRAAAVKRVQALLAPYKPAGVSIVDELLADRRAEAKREGGHANGRS